MTDDTLVLAEWYDQYIPPRHHMSVVRFGDALLGISRGYAIAIHPFDPEMLHDERLRTPSTDSPPSTGR